jgi:hypothetical protein
MCSCFSACSRYESRALSAGPLELRSMQSFIHVPPVLAISSCPPHMSRGVLLMWSTVDVRRRLMRPTRSWQSMRILLLLRQHQCLRYTVHDSIPVDTPPVDTLPARRDPKLAVCGGPRPIAEGSQSVAHLVIGLIGIIPWWLHARMLCILVAALGGCTLHCH